MTTSVAGQTSPCVNTARGADVPSQRDATIEDEVFHCGYFADVTFKFKTPAGDVDSIYGQRALFGLLSEPLRAILHEAADAQAFQQTSETRLEVWLGESGLATVNGFREVARYVYRLPQRFTEEALAEVLAAAHKLQLLELKEAALCWGLSRLAELRSSALAEGEPEDCQFPIRSCSLSYALQCVTDLCSLEPLASQAGQAAPERWRDALLSTFQPPEIFGSPGFQHLSSDALTTMLSVGALHEQPCDLWPACVAWAQRLEAATNGHVQTEESGPAPRLPPRILGSRLAVPAAVPKDTPEVEWQRCLLPAAERVPSTCVSLCTCLPCLCVLAGECVFVYVSQSKSLCVWVCL
eukprot:TRINITY_DN24183_c0_g1_i3.p1 TRINITY_DN24183_c0_g1~~TRINITY_DN24183_c0_g1_i3.p1  ORF type:complete len:367 (+),score=-2.22 TRINITY_DN24183_c0_g1_i3:46-1101(+)